MGSRLFFLQGRFGMVGFPGFVHCGFVRLGAWGWKALPVNTWTLYFCGSVYGDDVWEERWFRVSIAVSPQTETYCRPAARSKGT